MEIDDKKIYFIMSPHINYYHSYRGDSKGTDGFGLDLKIMQKIMDDISDCEDQGLCNGKIRITWDYSDLYWSIQLQRKFQPDILDQVRERVKSGKDEVIIGSWGNCALPVLNTEEFIQQCRWNMNNSMGIGLKQLFPGRIAPYIRVQETMFTQGMIELFNQVGVKGILNYYAVIPFDTLRPIINPRLDWNQRYGLVKFNSTVTDTSCLMIPMYGFGDIIDHLSVEKWFKFIRKKQESDDITGHALVVLGHDMDSPAWKGTKLPKILSWMPNTGGITEIIRAVDKLEFVELVNLLDIVPKLKIHGSCTVRPDVADGCWCGYYNWAQKYNNTKYWTLGQQARWLKCVAETLKFKYVTNVENSEINRYLRDNDDESSTYVRNMVLFSSTTHFGMSMPFQHPHRQKTAIKYGISAFRNAKEAFHAALIGSWKSKWKREGKNSRMIVLPVQKRGIAQSENKRVNSPVLVRTRIPAEFTGNNNNFEIENTRFNVSRDQKTGEYYLEGILDPNSISEDGYYVYDLQLVQDCQVPNSIDAQVYGSRNILKNEFIILKFNEQGKINSFAFDNKEFSSKSFFESTIVYGKKKNEYGAPFETIEVLEDGSNSFSASVKISSDFEIISGKKVETEKIIKIYAGLPHVYVTVRVSIPEIAGTSTSDSNIYGVKTAYNDLWHEIMPCEIRPGIIARGDTYLRIWKHNFLGHVTYFDLDMVEIDPKNADIDCLVSNISDGWMVVSNREQGLLIGFNSLKAANFAFTPIKVREEGFYDLERRGQQIRINPFGTYFGRMFHHWTDGTGHAQKIIPSYSSTFKSTAPTFSGKKIEFDLILVPYTGDEVPESVQSAADHFSLPPLIIFQDKQNNIYGNFNQFNKKIQELMEEYDFDEEILNMDYLEWVDKVNQSADKIEEKERDDMSLSIVHMIQFLIDGIRAKL